MFKFKLLDVVKSEDFPNRLLVVVGLAEMNGYHCRFLEECKTGKKMLFGESELELATQSEIIDKLTKEFLI